MTARQIANILLELEPPVSGRRVTEATVRLPPRSRKWVAVYAGPEPGTQVARSTGLEDREAALALAREWADEARRQRTRPGKGTKKPSIRVRRVPGAKPGVGPLTQGEVAALLNMSERAVREVECRAFAKLRRHPLLCELWKEYLGQPHEPTIPESLFLSEAEIAALFAFAETPIETVALAKLLAWIGVAQSWNRATRQ